MARRSRILWDAARRPGASKSALLRAIMYELQPIRFAAIDTDALLSSFRAAWKFLQQAGHSLPSIATSCYVFVHGITPRQWMAIGAVLAYYLTVRWIHQLLDAGPLVLIITALVAIFTIGLGDDDAGGVSAYSVFNRGFQEIMGGVDAEALLQQHVGGAMGMVGMMPQQQQQGGAGRFVNEPQGVPRRRNVEERPAAAAANDEQEEHPPAQQNRSRKSGKKARRRNLEQRKELQRQRQAAMAMGFGGGDEQEMMAMQRILEEQAAAAAVANAE